jgi:hypothetical protein
LQKLIRLKTTFCIDLRKIILFKNYNHEKKQTIIACFLFISLTSCNKTEEPEDILSTLPSLSKNIVLEDDPRYYDQDENCDTQPLTANCCDVDGRILVNAGKSYTYTYKTNQKLAQKPVIWTVLTGDIKIINGQGTDTAAFSFGQNFTTGKIQCTGYLGTYEDTCQNTIDISKL